MVTRREIQLSGLVKKLDPPRTREQRIDVQERFNGQARDCVEASIVKADAPRPVRLAC